MSIELTQAIAHELLDYFPHTGELRWRLREVKWFKNGKHSARHSCAMFNTQYAGKPAFNCTGPNGYLHGRIFNKAYYAHRVIFLWMIGRWPEPEVDHRNTIAAIIVGQISAKRPIRQTREIYRCPRPISAEP